ncbi:MerC domain-containing protein [Rhodocaloribacter litoris]|uniref:MerC domain-containing protein n=1 Tax=Rhodocaloribacter litoris TaxID=2558931 RepID=UPI0014203AB8|nr:MerC domain-containing protein [Rhodocaloribacter litoris]QXD15833.1 MerC domain-containing protein [Rhodocaloribacter litoris]GIV57095.1 MAG: hypothetical protein KatS3mg042_0008 [Rhodothermaceae bacterium]
MPDAPASTTSPPLATLPARPPFWDRLGIGISGLCMIHCLLLPVVLALAPLWPMAEELHAWLHPVFALLLVPTTLLALVHGYRRHRNRRIAMWLVAGLVIVLVAGVLGHEMPGAFAETSITVTGSVVLIAAHWRNWRAGAACRPHPPATVPPAS